MSLKPHIALHSPLTVEQCVLALSQAIGREDWFDQYGAPTPGWKSVVGKVKGNSFRLHRRKYTLGFRDYFVPAFWGSLITEPTGTRIEGRFHLTPFALVLMGAWLALAATMFILLSAPTLVDLIAGRKLSDGVWEVVFPPVAVSWGVVCPKWALWWHSEDQPVIRDFLCNTLSATVDGQPKTL